MNKKTLFREYVVLGKSRDDIMSEYNLTIGQLKRLLYKYQIHKPRKEHQAPQRGRRNDISKEILERLYYGKDMNYVQIAAQFNVNEATVYRWFAKYGIETKNKFSAGNNYEIKEPPGKADKIDRNKLASFIASGVELKEIAGHFGVSMPTLNKAMQMHELECIYYPRLLSEEDFYQKYIVENMSHSEIATEYGVGRLAIANLGTLYGFKKDPTKVFETAHRARKRSGKSWNISGPENEFYAFLVENYDADIQRQVNYPGTRWIIDFYSKKYDRWIAFDGDYWHGNLKKRLRECRGTPRYDKIMRAVRRDKAQSRAIPNLVRVFHSEFQADPTQVLKRL